MPSSSQHAPTGPWDSALEQLRAWDPGWAEACAKMATNPWTSGVLPRKFIELVGVALMRGTGERTTWLLPGNVDEVVGC